jgi:hypothetical protein
MTTSPSPQFVSTRVTQTNQVLPNCSLEKPTCTYVDVNSTEHFVADIGNFTVALPPPSLLFSAPGTPDEHARDSWYHPCVGTHRFGGGGGGAGDGGPLHLRS